MAGVYAVGGILFLVIGVVVAAYLKGRKAGAVSEQAKVAVETVEVQQKMDQAAAASVHTTAEVKDSLNKGTF